MIQQMRTNCESNGFYDGDYHDAHLPKARCISPRNETGVSQETDLLHNDQTVALIFIRLSYQSPRNHPRNLKC